MKNILDLKIEKLNNWTVVNDGSGNEFSSPILSNNNEGVNDIYRTCNFLKANKQKVSGLDGGHIHFDATFMKDRNAYINLLELYFSTEKLLYIISNEKGTKPREETVLDCGYAKPLSKMFFDRCQEMNEEEIETLKYLNDKEFINKIKVLQETRNFGINFSNVDDGSKMDINTIEFRMPNGTINPDVWIENINLFGGNTVYVYNGTEYKDRGYNAVDNCDGDMTDKINVNNNVDTNKDGEYNVTYSVVDTFGNKNTISRKVVVYSDISKVPKNGKVIYLTFDDGPGIYTQSILDVLNEYNVKATFFVTNQFSNYHYMIKKEYETGHSIAVHTYSHNYGKIYESVDSYVEDFNQMNQIILDETGTYTKMFRFPGGSSNTISKFNKGVVRDIAKTMNEKGYIYFDWNVDSNDAGSDINNSSNIYYNVINNVSHNRANVVLMHDSANHRATVNVLSDIIRYGKNNGYTFKAITNDTPVVRHGVNN